MNEPFAHADGPATAQAAARRERPADVLGGLTDDLDELRQGEPEKVVVVAVDVLEPPDGRLREARWPGGNRHALSVIGEAEP